MTVNEAVEARRRAHERMDLHVRGFDREEAMAWALIAIAAELAEIRKVMENKR